MSESAAAKAVPSPVDPRTERRAVNAVATGDLVAWRAVHAASAREADPDTRLATANALMGVLRRAPARLQASFGLVAAEAAVSDLESHPLEPARWAMLARLTALLGHREAAAACAAAACRLDPAYALEPTVGRRFNAARPLAARAAALAATVEPPAADGRLSVAMIVKDEERMLPDCLRSLAGVADEIVIVDTGSTDATVEIALSFGARVIHRPWDGSFANARNAGLDEVSGDWVMILDADERLVPEDGPVVRSVLGRPWRSAATIELINVTRSDGMQMDVSAVGMRLWRHSPAVRYAGIVHEQVAGLPRALPDRIADLPARVLHDGYRDEVVAAKDKFERNRRLLEQQAEESEGVDRAFALYNLGAEHLIRGSAEIAERTLAAAVESTEAYGGIAAATWGPMLAVRTTIARRRMGRPEQAEREAARWLELFPGHTDLAMERANAAFELDPERGLRLLDEAIAQGDGPAKYNSIVGATRQIGAALRGDYLLQMGRHREAADSYRRGLALNPDYLAGIGGLARSLLKAGTPAADVLEELRPYAFKHIEAAGPLLATAFMAAEATTEAEAVYEAWLARNPDVLEARVGLASCAVWNGDLAAAQRRCRPLPEDPEAAAPLAACDALCALLDGDAATADALLASGSGIHPAQAEALGAWRDLLRSAAPARLGADGARAALDYLGTAIRLNRPDACDALHRLITSSELAQAEARDGVAEKFYAAGYHEIAAEEWIAAIEADGPTGRALLGLARIAHANGEHQDALDLAAEARRLDPALAAEIDSFSVLVEATQVLSSMEGARA